MLNVWEIIKNWWVQRKYPYYQKEFLILYDKHLIQSFLATCPLSILDQLQCSPERHPLHYQCYKMRIMEVYGMHPLTQFEEVSYIDLSNYVKEHHTIRPIPLPHLLHFLGPTANTHDQNVMKTIFVRMLERPFLVSATFFHHANMEHYADIWLSLVHQKYDVLSERAKHYVAYELPHIAQYSTYDVQVITLLYHIIRQETWNDDAWYVPYLSHKISYPIAKLLHGNTDDVTLYIGTLSNDTPEECDIVI